MADRTVRVKLEAVIGPYQRAMAEASAATRKLSQEEKDLKKTTDDIGRGMQRAGVAMTVGFTAPLLLMAKHATDVAMTAEETANRVTVAFGEQEAALHMWSEGSAHSMGLARHEAEGTAATFSTMFQEMDIGRTKAFELSTGVVQLAADIGSFMDVDPSLMLEKMRAGVVGEYEPLRQLGIVLTDVKVRQEAVRLGLADSTDEVSTAALVQARYSLILDQSSKAQGDFVRTAHSATNASRTARAAFTDAMRELGENFIPLVAEGAETVTALSEAFSNVGPGGQRAILVFGGIAAAAGPAILVLGSLIRNLETIKSVAPLAASGLRGLTIAAGGVGAVLAIAGVAIALFGDRNADTAIDVQGLTQAIKDQADTLGDSVKMWAAQEIVTQGMDTLAKKAAVNLTDVSRAILGNADIIARLREEQMGWTRSAAEGSGAEAEAAQRRSDALGELIDKIIRLNGEYEVEQGEANRTAAAMEALGVSQDGTADSTDSLTDSTEEFTNALDELFAKTFGVQEATDAFTSDLADFADQVMAAKEAGDAHANSLSEGTLQGLKNRDMLRGLTERAADVAKAMQEAGDSPGEIAAAMESYRGAILNVLDDLGFSSEQANSFVDVLLQIDGIQAEPTITLNAAEARRQLDQFIMDMWAMQSGGADLGPIVAGIIGRATGVGSPASAPAVRQGVSGQGPAATAAREAANKDLKTPEELEKEAQEAAEAVKRYLEALYEHQMELEDNMFRFEAMSKDRYLQILEERLAGLEKYSNEWARVMDQIRQIRDEALDAELDIIKAYEAGRVFGENWAELAGQRALSDAYMTPVTASGNGSTYNTTKSLELNLALATSSPERVTADTLRAAAAASGF